DDEVELALAATPVALQHLVPVGLVPGGGLVLALLPQQLTLGRHGASGPGGGSSGRSPSADGCSRRVADGWSSAAIVNPSRDRSSSSWATSSITTSRKVTICTCGTKRCWRYMSQTQA